MDGGGGGQASCFQAPRDNKRQIIYYRLHRETRDILFFQRFYSLFVILQKKKAELFAR